MGGGVGRAREEVARERRVLKRSLREWESRWWEVRIEECREACEAGSGGDMYKVLRSLGKRGKQVKFIILRWKLSENILPG